MNECVQPDILQLRPTQQAICQDMTRFKLRGGSRTGTYAGGGGGGVLVVAGDQR